MQIMLSSYFAVPSRFLLRFLLHVFVIINLICISFSYSFSQFHEFHFLFYYCVFLRFCVSLSFSQPNHNFELSNVLVFVSEYNTSRQPLVNMKHCRRWVPYRWGPCMAVLI